MVPPFRPGVNGANDTGKLRVTSCELRNPNAGFVFLVSWFLGGETPVSLQTTGAAAKAAHVRQGWRRYPGTEMYESLKD